MPHFCYQFQVENDEVWLMLINLDFWSNKPTWSNKLTDKLPTATYTRGNCKSRSRLIVHSNFFAQRVIKSWNNLSDEIISSNTVIQFKAKLDKDWELDLKIGCQPNTIKFLLKHSIFE